MVLRKELRQGHEYWIAQLSTGRLSEERISLIRADLLTMPLGSIMVIDFTDINYIGSRGLGGLIKLLKLAKSCHVSIVITGLQQPIWALFELTKLHKIFPIHRDIDAWLSTQAQEKAALTRISKAP